MLIDTLPVGWEDLSIKERLSSARREYDYESPLSRLPCVYVRYDGASDTFYIGQTSDLYVRYTYAVREQVFYFEVITSKLVRLQRESELLQEFLDAGLPCANRTIPSKTPYTSVYRAS